MSEVSVRTVATGAHGPATGSSWRNDPFVARLKNIVDLSPPELESLRKVVGSELTIKKRRDLILDGYEYCKLCFVTDGFAARYKLLRNGKRQIVNFVLPGDVVGLPGQFSRPGRRLGGCADRYDGTELLARSICEAMLSLAKIWPRTKLACGAGSRELRRAHYRRRPPDADRAARSPAARDSRPAGYC